MAVDIIARGMAVNSGGGGGGNSYTKAETDALLAQKQNTLVSGTNIKTINTSSVLGSGDLEVGRVAYKHITQIQLVGESVEPYENNNLFFTINNTDPTEITTFEQLMSNFEPYETTVVYNLELNNTNMCITRVADNEASYSGSGNLPIDITSDDVVVVGDNVKKI